ncbi:MAG: ATP-binding protein [Thermodesulfobacteriota bacterium]
MQDLSLHILDIVENSLTAGAKQVEIRIVEDIGQNSLSIEIIDDGQGMDAELQAKALDPFFTTKMTRRVGLGLPLFKESCEICKGHFLLESQPGKGTKVKAIFPYAHIDRKPLGNLGETLLALIVGHPDADIYYEHKRDGIKFSLNTKEIKAILEDVPLNDPEVVSFLRTYIFSQLAELGLDQEYII